MIEWWGYLGGYGQGGHAVGTGHLWQLVRGGGSPEKMDFHLVQKVLSAKRGGVSTGKDSTLS